MRRALFLTLIVSMAALGGAVPAHAAIPFFGPIIPLAYNTCPGNWALVIDVINNIISLLITLAIVFVAPLMLAWSGFLLVANPFNPGAKEQARKMLTNTIVGIVIALAGWMIVDAVMAVFYDSDAVGETWWGLITSGGLNECLKQSAALETLDQVGIARPAEITGVSATGRLDPPQAGPQGSPCDPAAVQQGAAEGGYTLTNTQANILACIAKPESSCNPAPRPPNYAWGKGSSAAGAFQVLLSTNARCYENPACYAAAGVSKLDCAAGFSGGNPRTNDADNEPDYEKIVNDCLKAAENLACSASAAACLVQEGGGSFRPWQADVNSLKQTGCITSGA